MAQTRAAKSKAAKSKVAKSASAKAKAVKPKTVTPRIAKAKRIPQASRKSAVAVKRGDQVRVRFGARVVDGTVTSVSGSRVHVDLRLGNTDAPVPGLYRASELITG